MMIFYTRSDEKCILSACSFLEFYFLVFLDAVTCEDLATVRTATAVITIAYGLLAIICLVGSTYDCFETCCEAGVL